MTNEKFSKLFWPVIVVLVVLWIVCFAKAKSFEEKRQMDKLKALNDMYEKLVVR